MPANITDVSTFTSPIVGPVDGDAANGASIQTLGQGLANRTKKLKDDVDALTTGFTGLVTGLGYGVPVSTTKFINLAKGRPQQDPTTKALGWKFDAAIMGGSDPLRLVSNSVNSAFIFFPIELPSGAVITSVSMQCLPGSGGSMGLYCVRNAGGLFSPVTAPTTNVGTPAGSSGPGLQIVTVGALIDTVDNDANEYTIVCVAGSSAGSNPQAITFVSVTFSDHGVKSG